MNEKLLPCPFCGRDLTRGSRRINPNARCTTEDCYGAKMPVVNLDVPDSVAAWNHRAALPPLRAREEIARLIEKLRNSDDLNDQQITFACAEAADALSLPAGQEWREPLVEFARWAIRESVFEGTSIDGGSVQDKAQKLGLITETTYDPERHGPSEAIAGDQWFVFAEPIVAEKRPEETS